MINNELVFVYGTLKFGYSNSSFLTNAKIIGRGITKDKFSLYVGSLPYLTSEMIHQVKGEVYEVSKQRLAYLDSLEGHPNFYKRWKIKIKLENNKTVTCWTYFFNDYKREDWKLTDGEYKQPLLNNRLWQ